MHACKRRQLGRISGHQARRLPEGASAAPGVQASGGGAGAPLAAFAVRCFDGAGSFAERRCLAVGEAGAAAVVFAQNSTHARMHKANACMQHNQPCSPQPACMCARNHPPDPGRRHAHPLGPGAPVHHAAKGGGGRAQPGLPHHLFRPRAQRESALRFATGWWRSM